MYALVWDVQGQCVLVVRRVSRWTTMVVERRIGTFNTFCWRVEIESLNEHGHVLGSNSQTLNLRHMDSMSNALQLPRP